MSYKPDEITLINYLYGELTVEEKKAVEDYLKKNPEVAKEVQGLSDTRSITSSYEDKEVIPPVNLFRGEQGEKMGYKGRTWRMTMVIAASVSLLLIVGFLTGYNASYGNEGLTVGFINDQKEEDTKITLDQIEKLLEESMRRNRNDQRNELTAFKQNFERDYSDMMKQHEHQLAAFVNKQLEVDEKKLGEYARNLELRNAELINQYFESSQIEQQTYVKNLLIDFTAYLEEQRIQDRDFYLNRLIDLKLSTDLKQQETEQMLTSIIKSVHNLPNEETTQNF
ncbi:MAG: hypothetical protein AAF519_11680 [Bacteroidota bacterium]